MQLDRLSIKNYRAFDQAEFEFDPHLNLIIGWNGAGKSSLLFAIRGALFEIVQQIGIWRIAYAITVEDVRFEMQMIGTRVRFQPQYPSELTPKLTIDEEAVKYTLTKPDAQTQPSGFPYDLRQKFEERKKSLDRNPATVLPFFAFYGPKRNTTSPEISPSAAATERVSRGDGYAHWEDALISAEELQTWIVGKTLERLQIIAEEGRESHLLIDDELEIVNRTLDGCFPGLKGLRFDLRLRTLLIELHDGRFIPFMSLSDGQRGFVTLVADICRRMLIMNPQLGALTPQQTPGILMVDELDIHLHPDWQRRVLRALRERFPLLQIFATSHSPQMVGGLTPSEVLVLTGGKASHPEFTFGLDSSRILEDIMSAGSRESDVENDIRKIFKEIEEMNFDAARRRLAELRSRAPSLPEYVRAEALMRRVETIGR